VKFTRRINQDAACIAVNKSAQSTQEQGSYARGLLGIFTAILGLIQPLVLLQITMTGSKIEVHHGGSHVTTYCSGGVLGFDGGAGSAL
jgi:hypothetical protein